MGIQKSASTLQDFAYYQIISNEGACDLCAAHGGAIYPVAYADNQDYYPPFHPNCKCVAQGYYVQNPHFHPTDSGNLTIDPWKREIEFWLGIMFGGLSPEQQARTLMNYYDITDYTTEEIVRILASISGIMHIGRRMEAFRFRLQYKGAIPAVTVNGWLHLYESPTVSSKGRIVEMPDDFPRDDWAAFEGRSVINPWAEYMIEQSGSKAIVIIGGKGEVTDDEGRYWVALGPNVMNPNHKPGEKVTLEEMKYGSKVDVALRDSSGNLYYVPTIVGDVKNHTYPNGIYQTGYAYPDGQEYVYSALKAPIEFIGAVLEEELGNYEIDSIIVYD
jgi:hypothetical protein